MADYNVKLKVDTSQHDRAMEKSAGQVNYYAKRVMNAKDKIMGLTKAVPALALAVGGATAAFKGMKSILESTDSGFDQVHRTMSTTIQVFDQFKVSLASADFSNFLRGLDRIVARAKDAYNAIGDLDMFTLESSLPVAKLQAQIAEKRSIINDRLAPMEEREQAQKELRILSQQLKSIYEQQQKYTREAFDKNFIAKIGAPFDAEELAKYNIHFSEETIHGLLDRVVEKLGSVEVASGGRSPWQAAIDVVEDFYKSWYENYKAQHVEANRGKTGKEAQQARFALGEVYKGYQLVMEQIKNMRNIREDEYLDDDSKRTKKELLQLLLNMVGIETKMYSEIKMLNQASTKKLTSMDNTIDTAYIEEAIIEEPRGITGPLTASEFAHQDVGFNNTVGDVNSIFTTDVVDREEAVEDYKHFMDIAEQSAETLKGAFSSILGGVLSVSNSLVGLGQTLGDVFDSEEVTEFFSSLQQGLNILSSMFSVYESIANVIEMVNTMKKNSIVLTKAQTAASNAQVAANLAETSTESGKSIAKATASGAGLVFPYNLIAIAMGVAAVVSALSMIGKFADGGIIGGNSAVGDNMIARVNSGEMILNKRQQAHLFNLLDGAGTSIGNNSSTGNVTFRISGGDLVGVLNNQSKKKSRVL